MMPKIGDQITVHFLDSEYGSLPTVTTGLLGAPAEGRLMVGERSIIPADVISLHEGPCDHSRDERSDKARANFQAKYE